MPACHHRPVSRLQAGDGLTISLLLLGVSLSEGCCLSAASFTNTPETVEALPLLGESQHRAAQCCAHRLRLKNLPEVTSAPGSTAAEVLSAAGTGTAGPWETATPLAASLGARECTANSTSAASCSRTCHMSGDRGACIVAWTTDLTSAGASNPWLDRSA